MAAENADRATVSALVLYKDAPCQLTSVGVLSWVGGGWSPLDLANSREAALAANNGVGSNRVKALPPPSPLEEGQPQFKPTTLAGIILDASVLQQVRLQTTSNPVL